MEIFFFVVGILFVFYPIFLKRKNETFVDNFIIFCLFFDLTHVFVEHKTFRFIFSQDIIILIYTFYYFFANYSAISKITKNVFYFTSLFIIINLLFPLLYGDSLKSSFISTTQIITSFSILPIAFHYYATKGHIINLIKKSWSFILILISGIIFFTLFKIDSNYLTAEGDLYSSVASKDSWLYFGNFDIRGGFTYISFLVLLFPLFFILKIKRKIIISLGLSFLFLLMILSFKRMAILIVFIGIIIWLFSNYLSNSKKIKIILYSIIIVICSFIFFEIDQKIIERINVRGGNETIGIEAVKSDIRLVEFFYIYVNANFTQKLLGSNSTNRIVFSNDFNNYIDWTVHNQYAQLLLKIGIIGIISYFMVLLYIFKYTRKYYNIILSNNLLKTYNYPLWLTFITLFIAFIIAGTIGGLDKVTIRGIIFVFLGAIAGHFYKNAISK
tara:strand:- start:4 stop:1329 length:1326 start_codon:yes stop_codon:yes gene_type:complete